MQWRVAGLVLAVSSGCGVSTAMTGGELPFPVDAGPCADGGCSVDAGQTVDAGGQRSDGCSAEARLVYVLDQDRRVSSFDPSLTGRGEPFTELGRLSCNARAGAEPFSMSVDRHARAWVIYDSGELFVVHLRESLRCEKTTFAPQRGIARFGMGFVSNSEGSLDETLFVAGSTSSSLSTSVFATLQTEPPFALRASGQLDGAPELTGTGAAHLWAFFPNVSPPVVAELSKTDGSFLRRFEAPALAGSPRAWAFAFWGGDFYVFLERTGDPSTRVWKLDGEDGALSEVPSATGRRIVGAGVSTCAPVRID